MSSCIFCCIAQKAIPASVIYEDKNLMAFKDNNPQAPVHVLIIPKDHIETLNDLDVSHHGLIGSMIETGSHLARSLEIAQNGYRLVMNCGAEGGQTVLHIHLHLLGGRAMHWPPG